ncbi:hypothetical protein BDZ97DRAFT_1762200 [Flammula alnicola]|nr:hypothetical protein BDZ97DRAFT_1762200 [Flammula alnicola]
MTCVFGCIQTKAVQSMITEGKGMDMLAIEVVNQRSNTPAAPLICLSQGKLFLLAARHHALVICLALETGVIGMLLHLYQKVIAKDCTGPNDDVDKANELQAQ